MGHQSNQKNILDHSMMDKVSTDNQYFDLKLFL